jgi:O-antigen ligase
VTKTQRVFKAVLAILAGIALFCTGASILSIVVAISAMLLALVASMTDVRMPFLRMLPTVAVIIMCGSAAPIVAAATAVLAVAEEDN